MSDVPEDFEQLRRLLTLKRYEQPPPRYFNNFSDRVLARLERESERSGSSRWWQDLAWLGKFFGLFERNPMAAGVFGVGICGLLLSGIVYSQFVDQTPVLSEANPEGSGFPSDPRRLVLNTPTGSGSELLSNSNFFVGNKGSFDAIVQPVSFSVDH